MRRHFYRDRREAAHLREFGPPELKPAITADQALANAARALTPRKQAVLRCRNAACALSFLSHHTHCPVCKEPTA